MDLKNESNLENYPHRVLGCSIAFNTLEDPKGNVEFGDSQALNDEVHSSS